MNTKSVWNENIRLGRHNLFMAARSEHLFVLPETIRAVPYRGGYTISGEVVPIKSRSQLSNQEENRPVQNIVQRLEQVYSANSDFRKKMANCIKTIRTEDGSTGSLRPVIVESIKNFVVDGELPEI